MQSILNRWVNLHWEGKKIMTRKLEAIIFSICISLGILSCSLRSPKLDSDILWSIAIGKWITLNRAFLFVDSFSWTINGKERITLEWLFCFLAYKFNDWLGSWGLYILIFISVIVTVYGLYLICAKYDTYVSYAFITPLILGITILYTIFPLFRAYVYALMFFIILIYLLFSKKESEWDLLYYAILFVLWVNIHASVCLGFFILCIEMSRRIIVNKKVNYLWTILLCGLATLVNPYGYLVWTNFLSLLVGMGGAKPIAEFRAPDFNNLAILGIYLSIAVIMLLFLFKEYRDAGLEKLNEIEVVTGKKECHNSPTDNIFLQVDRSLPDLIIRHFSALTCLVYLFWVFYIYALYSVRMLPYAIVLWIILTAYYASKIKLLNFTKRTYYLFVGLFSVLFLGNLFYSDFKVTNILESNNSISPSAEVQFLKNNPKYQDHLFNEYIFGGYLILNNIPVFIDAGGTTYGDIMQKYIDVIQLKEDPQKILDDTGVKNIIIPNDIPFARYLSVNNNWELVYRGNSASIFTNFNLNE